MFQSLLPDRLTDAIDIAFVAVLLYTAILWMKTARAALVVVGMFILGAVFILARQLDLQLTAWIFQGFIAIFLIIIVVIFQEELRQYFERIAVWSLRKGGTAPPGSEMTDILLGTLEDLARAKVGALIVVRGNDPLERHITGGIELGGRLSEPLLKSVFDPHSPGHDGAVIIERGRLSRFATHLPLSKDIEQLGQAGTRHCAALGLAELTDALCLVVSEERGKISYARGARIREVASLQEMGAQLQGFLKEKYPPPRRRKFSLQMLSQRWAEKLASLLLAVALWSVFIPGSKIDVVTYRIPVKVENLPPDLALNGVNPSEVSVTFTAPRRAFYIFDPGKLRVSIDASVAELGRRTFEISEKNVFYPKDFTLEALAPSTIRITVRKVSAEGRDGKKSAS